MNSALVAWKRPMRNEYVGPPGWRELVATSCPTGPSSGWTRVRVIGRVMVRLLVTSVTATMAVNSRSRSMASGIGTIDESTATIRSIVSPSAKTPETVFVPLTRAHAWSVVACQAIAPLPCAGTFLR